MKLVLDTCVWGGAAAELRGAGYQVEWIGDWPHDPGDVALLAHAHQEAAILITLDKDFGTLAVHEKQPHSGIIRLVSVPARSQAAFVLEVLQRYGNQIVPGTIVTVEPERVRFRDPEA